jgi:tRNA (guanine-N7-)-methyltransferase
VRKGPRLPLDQLAPFLLELPPSPAALDWTAVFGNDRPVEIEVGFGKGMFLVLSALGHPEVNYLGVEVVRKYQLYTATRLARQKLANVRLVCADARRFLRDFVAAESVRAVHVYFPDPWWKLRHHKRRVFTADFVAACRRSLILGGQLHVASDVADYFALITELLGRQPGLKPVPAPAPHEPRHDLDYLTNFERKYRKVGKPIFRGAYERVG